MSEKRRKPWYRPRNIVLVLLLVFFAWAASWIYWALTVEPSPSVDYEAEMVQLSADVQPPGEDAWPHLREAFAILDRLDAAFPEDERPEEHRRGLDYGILDNPDASPGAIQLLRDVDDWLRQQGAYEHLAAAAACPRMVRPLDSAGRPLIEVSLRDLAQARGLAKWRWASMRLALEDGREADAIDAFVHTFRLGRLYTYQPTLIDALVGHAIMAGSVNAICFELTERRLTPESLRRIIDLLDEDGRFGSMAFQIDCERRFFLDFVQRLYSDDGDGDGWMLPAFAGDFDLGPMSSLSGRSPSGVDRLSNLLGVFYPRRRTLVARAHEIYDTLVSMTEMPRSQRMKVESRLQNDLFALGHRFHLLNVLIPAVGKAIHQSDSLRCQIRGPRLLAAIELHRLEHGAYPASLDELSPSLLAAVPEDPLTGQPFVYRLVEADPFGRALLLYSVGLDGIDDGGATLPEGRGWALSENASGPGDYVFNLPRAADAQD